MPEIGWELAKKHWSLDGGRSVPACSFPFHLFLSPQHAPGAPQRDSGRARAGQGVQEGPRYALEMQLLAVARSFMTDWFRRAVLCRVSTVCYLCLIQITIILIEDIQPQVEMRQDRPLFEVSITLRRRARSTLLLTLTFSSCKRRGCSAICPNGSLITGQGTR